MPIKKKTRSERLNEELDPFAEVQHDGFEDERPAVDDYDVDADASHARVAGGKAARDKKTRLRFRGPLDESLSSGKYAAVPRHAGRREVDEDVGDDEDMDFDAADAEGNMDDIFGMFDEDAQEHTAGLKSEQEFERYLEERAKTKRKPSAAKKKKKAKKGEEQEGEGEASDDEDAVKDYSHLDEGDADVMRQIHELRSGARKLAITVVDADGRTQEGLNENVELGRECVALYNQLLAYRMKLQPVISAAVRLPQYYALDSFVKHAGASLQPELSSARTHARAAVANLFAAASIKASPTASVDKLWAALTSKHAALMAQVDAGVARWGHRAQVASDPKLKAVNRPLIEQIRGVIGGKQRLLHRAQRNRAHVHIFGHPEHFEKSAADRAEAVADGDVDREIFDDADFIKEIALQQGAVTSKALEKLMPETALKADAKKGHHRKTKGRTVSYDPRAKIVGFMVPTPYEESDRYAALLRSLFGETHAEN
jgi:protein AATF/BFR2